MRILLFSYFCILFFNGYPQSETKDAGWFKNYYQNHFTESISFDSLNYSKDCLYRRDSLVYSGYAHRIYSDKSLALCSVKYGRKDVTLILDSLLRVKEVFIDSIPGIESYYMFFDSGNVYLHYLHQEDTCDSTYLTGIRDVFGPSPRYLYIEEYYPSGNLKRVIRFDSLYHHHGKSEFYYDNGKKLMTAYFDHRERVGKWKQYNRWGICVGFIKWKDDKMKQAKWFEYDSNTNCLLKNRLRNGEKTKSDKCYKKSVMKEGINLF